MNIYFAILGLIISIIIMSAGVSFLVFKIMMIREKSYNDYRKRKLRARIKLVKKAKPKLYNDDDIEFLK